LRPLVDSPAKDQFSEPAQLGEQEVTKLFVGNLPYKAVEADVQAFFEEAGVQVDSVSILRDRFSGEARGFGFVEIGDDAAAQQAVQACNGRALMGRALVVNEARPPEKRERSSGGGPGGGGGRGQRDFGGSKNRW
jgi:RNA recognition motif-containing protein